MTNEDRDYILITVAKYLARGELVATTSTHNTYKCKVPWDVQDRLNEIVNKYEEEKAIEEGK